MLQKVIKILMKNNFLIVLALTFLIPFLENFFLNPIVYFLDEQVYIKAGLKYLRGIPPHLFNYEHPPLAKYIIGLFAIKNIQVLLPIIAITLTVLLIMFMAYYFLKEYFRALMLLGIILTDTLIINMLFFNLLDQIALLFSSASLYFILKYLLQDSKKYPLYIFGILMGLAIASKWSSLYILVPVIISMSYLRHDFIKRMPLVILMAFMTYSATFIVDFIKGGILLYIKHNIDMLNYMIWRHALTIPLIINGFLTLICKMSFWSYEYHENLTLTIINSTHINYTLSLVKIHKLLIQVEFWLGSLAWPLMLYYSLRLFLDSLKYKSPHQLVISSATLGAAMLPILHGNIAWYYFPFALLAPIAMVKYVSRKWLAAILILNIIQLFIIELGLVNPEYTFVIP